MKRRWPYWLLACLSLAFFAPYIFRGHGFLYGDNLTQRIPTLTFFKEEVLNGRLPLWNPYILGGIPFLADLSNNTFAPTNVLYILLPVPVALTMLVVLYVWAASLGTYLYVCKLTKNPVAGLVSAVSFAFSGTVIASVNDVNSLQGIALIPLVLYAAHRWIELPTKGRSIWLVISLTLQFFSSHPQYSYYTWLTFVSYTIWMWRGKKGSAVISLVGIVAATFGLAAMQLVPFFELAGNAFRPESMQFGTQNELRIVELPRFIVANFYGSWEKGSSWGPGSQMEVGLATTEGYAGLIPLILAAMIALRGKGKTVRFWTAVAVLALILSLGGQTPLYGTLRNILPLFAKFRSPVRILSMWSFAVAVLAGMALSDPKQRKPS